MFFVLWKGILLGLGAAVPIGPVNVEIARRALRHGFHAGFFVGCGAVTVDICYAVLASFSIRPFLDRPRVMMALGIAGALLLAWLGISCLISAFRASHADLAGREAEAKSPRTAACIQAPCTQAPYTQALHRGYITGLLMTSLNPMTLAFWFVVVPGVAGQISAQPSRDLPFICAGVFLGAFSWVCFFSTLMSLARRANRPSTLRIADAAGGIMLLAFALYAAAKTFPL